MACAAEAEDTSLECPVCHEDYQEPKILPCTHLVCRKCIVSWITKEGSQGGCPLCRISILSSTLEDYFDFASLVDALPTDLTIQALVDNQKVLNSQHVCGLCEGKVAASSYCLQCSIKLCGLCSKSHTKIPSLKSHVVEDLDALTAQRLAETCRTTCKNHTDRVAELYCFFHEELICMVCFPTNHRSCPEVKAVTEAASQKRKELQEKAAKLFGEEAKLSSKIHGVRDKYTAIRKKVGDVFDDLERSLRDQRQALNDKIQAEEDAGLASLSQLEKARAALKAHAGTVKNLVDSAADDALLGMLGKLTSRLQEVEKQTGIKDLEQPVVEVLFDEQELKALKDSIPRLGQIRKPALTNSVHLTASTVKPRIKWPITRAASSRSAGPSSVDPDVLTGEDLAKILRVGHRVKRGPDWRSGDRDGGGPGTVVDFPTALPTVLRLAGYRGRCARVSWDNTAHVSIHRMGDGIYELELL